MLYPVTVIIIHENLYCVQIHTKGTYSNKNIKQYFIIKKKKNW